MKTQLQTMSYDVAKSIVHLSDVLNKRKISYPLVNQLLKSGTSIAANIAETGILGFDACFPDSVIGVVPNPNEAEVGYVEYVLQSFKARLQALGQGSAQANINMGTFENERFPFPKVEEQRGIVAKLDALSQESQRLESMYRQKLSALDDLKKSLLHQAFSGQM